MIMEVLSYNSSTSIDMMKNPFDYGRKLRRLKMVAQTKHIKIENYILLYS